MSKPNSKANETWMDHFERVEGLKHWDSGTKNNIFSCNYCGYNFDTNANTTDDLMHHIKSKHDITESKASEGRYIIAGSGFEVDESTDDLELAKSIANDASAEEITTTPDFEYPQGELKGTVTDMDTGDRIYTAESKASEDHDSNYDYLENRDTQEDNVCAECGFVTSDNSEYLDHLNSHEE